MELTKLKSRLEEINQRLADHAISDSTLRELLKTKNELLADIQAAKIHEAATIPQRTNPISFEL